MGRSTHSMSSSEKLGKNPIQQLNLSRGTNDAFINHSTGVDLVFDAFEKERMLTNLSELHKFVTETFDSSGFTARNTSASNQRKD